MTEQLVRLKTGEFVRMEPKTAAGVRSISISPFTTEVLTEHVHHFANPGPDGLVFPNAAGSPLAASSFLTHHFRTSQRAASVLRHTSVALAIADGSQPKAIQARMGHASINVKLDRYASLFPELDEAIAEAFGRRLEEAQRRRATNVIQGVFGNDDGSR